MKRRTVFISTLAALLLLNMGVSAQSPARPFMDDVYHYIENPQLIETNQEPGHASMIPYATAAKALARDAATDRVCLLNGTWKFRLSPTPETSPKDFFQTDFDDSEWGRITVPSNWQMEGYDTPLFRNIATPFKANPPFIPRDYNPVGSYLHQFEIPAQWSDRQIILRFEGVASASFVWINGHEVGYNQGAMEPAEYDITPYVKVGKNQIAVNVYQYSDGVYLEDQDMWRLAGIFRDVMLVARPKVSLFDYFVHTDFDESYSDSQLNLQLQLKNYSEKKSAAGLKLTAELFDEERRKVFTRTLPVGPLSASSSQTYSIQQKVRTPQKWTAETPHLYILVLALSGPDGRMLEAISTRIGFRQVEINKRRLLVNGVPVKLYGVNSHQQHPRLGHAMNEETIRKDFELMKRLNINNIRTSHYPPTTRYLELADEYGFYIIDEVGNEAHATEHLSSLPEWLPAYLERTEKLVLRDRNHPSIIMWSAGNESGEGDNIGRTIARGKELDPTRPGWMYGANSDDLYPAKGMACEDIIGPRYPTPMELEYRVARVPESEDPRPSYMDEYLSATGNSIGALDEYWDIIHRYPRCIGGAIWDWVSPGLDVPLSWVQDYSASSLRGVLMGNISAIPGRQGKAVSLSGNDEWIEFYRDPKLDITGKELSLSIWLKPSSWNGGKSILTKGANQYGLRQLSASEVEFYLHTGKERKSLVALLPPDWEGQWHHVAAVYNGKQMRLYIDRQKLAEQECFGDIFNFPFQLNVGRDAEKEGMETRNHLLQADVDHVSVFAKACPIDELYDCSERLLQDARLWVNFDEVVSQDRFYTLGIGARAYGVVWPDRTLQPEAMQIKKSGQPLHAEWDDLPSLTLRITNRFSFTNFKHYRMRFLILKDGHAIDEWSETLDVAPLQSVVYKLPSSRIPAVIDGSEYHLQVSLLQQNATPAIPANYEVAWEELELPWKQRHQLTREQVNETPSGKAVEVLDSDTALTISGRFFAYVFDKKNGTLSSLQYHNSEYLERGPIGNVWRAPLSNESDSWGNGFAHTGERRAGMGNGPSNPWFATGLDRLISQNVRFSWKQLSDGNVQVTVKNVQQSDNFTTVWEDLFLYTIALDGRMTLKHTLIPWGKQPAWIPKAGIELVLNRRFRFIEWFGRGPEENYPDRKTGYKTGIYRMPVKDMYVPYLEPQDYGNRTDVRYCLLTDAEGNGMKISGSALFNLSARLVSTDNLTRARYPFQLNFTDDVTLNIDYEISGVGCNAISVMNRYRVFPRQFTFTTIFEPIKNNN